jgi:hypothetical protein
VIDGLLEGDESARASRVTHVHALDGRLEPEGGDDVGIEARTQPTRAGGGREKIHVGEIPARALHHASYRLRSQIDGAAPETLAELVHALVGSEGLRIEVEMASLDLAVPEEARAERVIVTAMRRRVA